jgi:hypothetical protein
MANIAAAQNGDFSATSTWVGGVVPGSGDVAYANTFTVTVSDTRTVQAVSNASATGITYGGTFSLVNNCNLTCTNANGCIVSTTTTGTDYLPIRYPISTSALTINSVARLNGNFTNTGWGGQEAAIILFSGAGTLIVTGNLTAGTANYSRAVICTGTGTFNLIGNLKNGSAGANIALEVKAATTVTITGDILTGPAEYRTIQNDAGNITITGNVIGASVHNGATITVNGTCQSSASYPAFIQGNSGQVTRLSGPLLLGATGNVNPIQAYNWRWAPTQIPTYMEVPTSGGSTKRNLYTADNMPTGGYPVVANVRQSTVYGPSSEFTGTLAVPSPSSVALGVATDNTVGTAVLTAASVRSAMGLASANLDTQFSGIPAAVWAAATRTLTTAIPTAADVASAVWSAASRTLTMTIPTAADVASAVWSAVTRTITGGTVDTLTNSPNVPSAATIASAVWSAISRTITGGTVDTLTNAPTVPSAAAIASQVRTELSTELGRIDVATSTRLAPAGTLARVTITDTVTTLTNSPNVPSAASIAAAVRTELSAELGRIDVATSTRLSHSGTLARVTLVDTVTTLTNSPNVPSAANIASTVRTELSAELARLDAPVTTRLAAANYTAPTTPPTTTAIAAQVRTELSSELARVANCSTVDTTATTIQDAVSG